MWIIFLLLLLAISILPPKNDFVHGNNRHIQQSKWNINRQHQSLNIHNVPDHFNSIQRIKRSKSQDLKDYHSTDNNKDPSNSNDKNDHDNHQDDRKNVDHVSLTSFLEPLGIRNCWTDNSFPFEIEQ
ncbi:hypothetical protein Smp_139170 [Schistosoma mansoni]|uniref:hypothetical protein n=1 Tax=Schistosoma mansoni TaxID=6183 RepID=UPI00019B35DB|nr:hypothetical protein Smp_139170 [Schistosoma mansoni]|eukprot:XP_018645052.1 hypothetical protein Smp_139170 [Schistosoma mansoni]